MVLAAAIHARAQVPASAGFPPGTNVIVGRVLDRDSGEPIPGAQVSLVGYVEPDGRLAGALPASAQEFYAPSHEKRVMTSASGAFAFRDLPAGRFRIYAAALGYAPPDYQPRVVEVTDRGTPTGVTLRLWQYGGISGRVIDERGEPVVGVQVGALPRRGNGTSLVNARGVRQAATDDRGAYRITDLPPGAYVVGVLATSMSLPASLGATLDSSEADRRVGSPLWNALRDGGAADVRTGEGTRVGDFVLQQDGPTPVLDEDGHVLIYPTTFHPGTASVTDAGVIDLRSGESRAGIDIPVAYSRMIRVSGVVTGPDGPVGNLKLSLLPPEGTSVLLSDPAGVASAVTDATGAFSFLAAPPGQYRVSAAVLTLTTRNASGSSTELSLWASDPLVVGDADVSDVVVTLRAGASISGRVEFSNASGPALAPDQRVLVSLRPVGARVWRAARPEVADSAFTLRAPPGRYEISASIACRQIGGCATSWTWQRTTLGGTPVPFDVVELETADLSDLVLTFSERSTRVSGSIVDGTGAPVTDPTVDVVAFPADTTHWQQDPLNHRRVRLAHATSTGAFEIEGLAPGDYYAVAIESGYPLEAPGALDRLIPGATTLTLGEGQQANLRLRVFTPTSR